MKLKFTIYSVPYDQGDGSRFSIPIDQREGGAFRGLFDHQDGELPGFGVSGDRGRLDL